ncbi:NADH:flavin oxidoreductase [Clostridiisalibacter paucivorans]|uniref:NADH:flavin oxidoreductase n=1 Tax=Clostridiisalibacter paucivorans TaxID=408753 RepID=UPI00047B1001|nr:NADH:flavin oxidoreductase [Clostridiisalibacter paucivorans]
MKSLFDSTKLGNMDIKNRIVRSATWERMAKDGRMTDKLFNVYRNLAKGGVGLIITGYSYIVPEECPNPGMMGICDDSYIDEYRALIDMVHKNNCKIVMQIAYGGSKTRYNTEDRTILGPSAVPEINTGVIPKEMTKKEIEYIVKAHGDAALRVKRAGFDGVQFHSAHGYLLSQFLNPHHNVRTDEYGGSIENRARIILEAFGHIREKVGNDFPVLIKINCSDFMDNGLTFEESKYVCRQLSLKGIDGIEISGGVTGDKYAIRMGIKTSKDESYHSQYAKEIADVVDVPVILVGGNRSVVGMENILRNSNIDMFSMSRPFIRESNLVNRWLKGDLKKSKCISCNQCFRPEGNICIFNK